MLRSIKVCFWTVNVFGYMLATGQFRKTSFRNLWRAANGAAEWGTP